MTWARPDLLPLLVLVPLVALIVGLGWRWRARALAALAAVEAQEGLIPAGVGRARGWQAALAVAVAAALAVAAAGPRVGFDWQQRRMEGVSIVVVLDVSRSMDAADVAPSRMERARRELVDLAGVMTGDAVGLVLFAQGAWVRIPLTVDYDTFVWAVKDSATDTIRAQGTALSGALDAAVGMLGRAPASGRAILVVSDGEVHEPAEAVDAALARAREAGVRVYALGVGDSAGAPVPLPDGGFKKDDAGQVVLSRLDEERLRALAAATGGAYVRSVVSDDDVRELYLTEMRGKLEAAERGTRREQVWRERFQLPLAAALAGLVLSAALGVGWRSRRLAVLALLLVPTLARAGVVEDGWAAYQAGRWEDAARLLAQARVERPDDDALARGLATALYRAGRYREAEQYFRTLADAAEGDPQRAVDLYNAGNAAYRGGRLDEALGRYEQALKLDPGLAAAQKNAEAVRKEIALRRNPPPPEDREEPAPGEEGGSEGAPAGEAGEPGAEGSPGETPEGQAGEPGQPGPSGEPGEPGDQGRPGEAGASGRPGEPSDAPPSGAGAPGDDGTREPGEGMPTEGALGEGGAEAREGEDGMPVQVEAPGEDASAMSADQAARLVDGVPEGRPRVVKGGNSGREDW